MIRPSALPALAVSPRFESGPGGSAAQDGQDRHLALNETLTGQTNRPVFDLLSDEDQETVAWAADHITSVASLHQTRIESELPLRLRRDGVDLMKGTADAVAGNHLFDLKTGERNYHEQMCAYALALMQRDGFDSVFVHLLFGETRTVQQYQVTRDQCEQTVFGIVDRVNDPTTECAASSYCGWCRHHTVCPVILGHVNKVAEGYEMVTADKLDLVSPDQVAAALNLAEVATKWADEVRSKALDMMRAGMPVTGWTVKERSAGREIDPQHISTAFDRMRLTEQQFLSCCKVSVKKLVDQLVENGISRKEAVSAVDDRLRGLLITKPAVQYITKAK